MNVTLIELEAFKFVGMSCTVLLKEEREKKIIADLQQALKNA